MILARILAQTICVRSAQALLLVKPGTSMSTGDRGTSACTGMLRLQTLVTHSTSHTVNLSLDPHHTHYA